MLSRFKIGVVIVVFFALLPLLTLAQTDAHTSTGGLVPCGAGYGFLGATECGLCDLSTLMQNIINFLLGITIPISIGLFAWAGILYFTAVGNPAQIQRARKIFKSVLIGFLIALSGWLVVQTILNALVNQNFFLSGSWNGLQCYPDSARPRESSVGQIFSFGSVTQGGVSPAPTPTSPVAGVYSDEQARAALAGACTGSECFTYTSTGNCSNAGNSTCTSLDGVQRATIDRLVALQRECGCSVNISGGTETGHGGSGATNVHTSGAAIDLKGSTNIDRIIKGYPSAGQVSVGGGTAPAYRAPDGTLFINEGTHWHLQMPSQSI